MSTARILAKRGNEHGEESEQGDEDSGRSGDGLELPAQAQAAIRVGDVAVHEKKGTVTVICVGVAADFFNQGRVYVSYQGEQCGLTLLLW